MKKKKNISRDYKVIKATQKTNAWIFWFGDNKKLVQTGCLRHTRKGKWSKGKFINVSHTFNHMLNRLEMV